MRNTYISALLVTIAFAGRAQVSTLENGHGGISYYTETNQVAWFSEGSVVNDTIVKDGTTVETDQNGGVDIVLGQQVKASKPYNSDHQREVGQNVIRLHPNTSITLNRTKVLDTGIDAIASGIITLNHGSLVVKLTRRSNLADIHIRYNGGEIIASEAAFILTGEGDITVISGTVTQVQGGQARVLTASNAAPGSSELPASHIPSVYWQTVSKPVQDTTQTYVSPTQGAK
jgi:hypothetical protein